MGRKGPEVSEDKEGKSNEAKSEEPGTEEEFGEPIEVQGDLEIEELRARLDQERKRVEDISNKMLYLQADFENYRRRIKAELEELSIYSNQELILRLLTVMDELELAIKAGEGSKEAEPLVNGVKMALKSLNEVLEREGVTKIDAVGKQFDPKLHEATEKVPASDVPEGKVVEEVRSGFMLRGKVIRPSMVKVSCMPSADDSRKGEMKKK